MKAKDFFLTLIGLALRSRPQTKAATKQSKVYPHSSVRQFERAKRRAHKAGARTPGGVQ